MRLCPAVSVIGRQLVEDDDLHFSDNITIPKGANVVINIYSMFRQSWIDRAEEFIP